VTLDDARRVFVKAVGPEPNPHSPGLHRREIEIVSSLPDAAPVPRLLWSHDEEWVVLVFEDVEGREPAQPWRPDELDLVLGAATELARALTPSPVETRPAGEALSSGINSWHHLQAERALGLDDWSLRHLEELVALETGVRDAVAGDTLVHLDIRADNILIADERVYFVDWPHAHVGAPWLDAVAFAPSVAMQGGPDPEQVLERWPGAQGADPRAVDAALASVAGFFTYRALLPPPPGLPTLRAFQAAQGDVARAWLARRIGLS
jgi:serine/threonine protein kinase